MLETSDPSVPGGFAFGLSSDIEDVLERRGAPFPTPTEIVSGEQTPPGS